MRESLGYCTLDASHFRVTANSTNCERPMVEKLNFLAFRQLLREVHGLADSGCQDPASSAFEDEGERGDGGNRARVEKGGKVAALRCPDTS